MNPREIMYTCPYCGKQHPINIYEAINVGQESEMRDRAVMGEIFIQTCPKCGKKYMVQNELTYVDPIHKFVIYLSTKPTSPIPQHVLKPLLDQGYILRRCATVAEFTEKIQVLEDGVNDVMVELAKYDSYIEFIDNKKGEAEDVTAVEYQRTENGIMKINVKTNDKGMAFIIPLGVLEEEMAEHPDLYTVNNAEFPLVNADWMISLFQEPDGVA